MGEQEGEAVADLALVGGGWRTCGSVSVEPCQLSWASAVAMGASGSTVLKAAGCPALLLHAGDAGARGSLWLHTVAAAAESEAQACAG